MTRLLCGLFILLGFCAPSAFAVTSASPTPPIISPTKKLFVGIYNKPPYAIKNDEGQWTGLSVDLWARLARKLNLTYEYREMPYEEMIPALRSGKLDFVIAELPVESDLEKVIDFSQPFLTSSLAIAVPAKIAKINWFAIIENIFDKNFLIILLCIVVGIFVASFLIWWVEQKSHNDHFGGKKLHGFGSAVWFSAVTMTTVGYGDKTPQTLVGRLIAFLWMMAGVLIIAGFTAAVASTQTQTSNAQLMAIRPQDLHHMRVGVVTDSSAEKVLKKHNIKNTDFKSSEDALEALTNGKLDAVVDDRMVIAYYLQNGYGNKVRLLPVHFHEFFLSFAMPDSSPIRETLNIELLDLIHSSEWNMQLSYWLGKDNSPAF